MGSWVDGCGLPHTRGVPCQKHLSSVRHTVLTRAFKAFPDTILLLYNFVFKTTAVVLCTEYKSPVCNTHKISAFMCSLQEISEVGNSVLNKQKGAPTPAVTLMSVKNTADFHFVPDGGVAGNLTAHELAPDGRPK